jgi:phospholipase/lecithinase/hemolysin
VFKSSTILFSLICLATPVVANAQTAVPASSESAVVLGDSLSDSGNFFIASAEQSPPAEYYLNGRYSNGLVWADRLDSRSVRYVELLAGGPGNNGGVYNFAVGGSDSSATPFDPATGEIPGAVAQARAYRDLRSTGVIGNNAAARRGYIWTGTNDYIGRLIDPNRRAADDSAYVSQVVSNISMSAATLRDSGVKDLLIFNLYAFDTAPGVADLIRASPAFGVDGAAFIRQHNRELLASVSALNGTSQRAAIVDVSGLFRDITARPSFYGLRVIDSPCLTDSTTNVCGAFNSAESTSRLYWDGVHLSATGHSIVYQFVKATERSAFDGPRHANAIGDAIGFTVKSQGQWLESQFKMVDLNGDDGGSVNFSWSRSNARLDASSFSIASRLSTDTFGMTASGLVSPSVRLGAAASYTKGNTKLDQNLGRASLQATGLSLFGMADIYGAKATWYGTYSFIEASNIQRATDFLFNPMATSDAKGRGTEFGLEIQRTFKIGQAFGVTPFAALNLNRWTFGERQEANAGVVALDIGGSKRSELLLRAGFAADASFRALGMEFQPSLRITYSNSLSERRADPVILLGSGQTFRNSLLVPDKNSVAVTQHLTVILSERLRLVANYETQFNSRFNESDSINLGIVYGF